MDVSRCSKAVTGIILLMFMAIALPVKAEEVSKGEKTVLAGPIGKSSSASARITLVIPPPPESRQKKEEQEQETTPAQNSSDNSDKKQQ